MKVLDPEPILASRARPWFDMFQLDVPREVAAEWFGCAPHVASVDGLGEAYQMWRQGDDGNESRVGSTPVPMRLSRLIPQVRC